MEAEGWVLVEVVVTDPRRAEFGTWTTLVTVIVCLMLLVVDCFVTEAPSDGN